MSNTAFDVEGASANSSTNDGKSASSGGKSRWYSLSSMMNPVVNHETPDSSTKSRDISVESSSSNGSSTIISRCIRGNYIPDYKIIAAFIVIFMAFIICVGTDAPTMMYPVAGGTVGVVSGLIIICWYLHLPSKDRAPHIVLILWRAVCDTAVAIRFLTVTKSNTAHGSSCGVQSFTLEFFEIGAELWFLCIALDLLYSVTNPFSTFKERIKKYHYFVWSVSFFFATLLVSVKGAAGTWQITSGSSDNTSNICWLNMNRSEVKDWIPWIFFYLPIIFVYSFSAYVLVYSYSRLKNGISKTLLHRLRILIMNTITVTVSISYWIILGSLYVASFFNDMNPTDIKWLFRIILFMMSAKGYSSFIVWLLFLNLTLGNNSSNSEDIESFDLNVALRQEVMLYATRGVRISTRLTQKLHADNSGTLISKPKLLFVMDSTSTTTEDVPDDSKNLFTFWYFLLLIFGKEEQKQVLQSISLVSSKSVRQLKRSSTNVSTRASVTAAAATVESVDYADTFANKVENFEVRQSDVFNNMRVSETFSTVIIDDDDVTGIEMKGADEANRSCVKRLQTWWDSTFKSDKILESVDFTAFKPYQFSRIRKAAGISEDMYINSFKSILKERLTQGGASGSFFFYSEHEYFIGKSCTEPEMSVLIENAEKFANYMCDETNNGTFISKIYGAYRLRIYGVSLYFFVMMNIFLNDENLSINEKYDIKGSWVSRNATPAIHGQQATCTHCGQKFIFSNAAKKKFNAATTKDTNKVHFNQLNMSSSFFVKGSSDQPGSISTIMNFGSKQNSLLLSKVDERSNNSTSSSNIESGGSMIDTDNSCFYTVDGYHEPNVIMKDNDLKYKILLPIEVARKARRQLRQDAAFLCSIGIMDYSLLVGVHKSQFDLKDEDDDATTAIRQSSPSISSSSKPGDKSTTAVPFAPPQSEGVILLAKKRGTLTNTPVMEDGNVNPAYGSKKLYASKVMGPDLYLMGIIDFQQEWNFQKKLERFLKVVIKGEDALGLSAIEPNQYYTRFVGKIDDILNFR